LYQVKDKIVEVWAVARIIVQRYGHTKKFAKHIVAFAIKQERNFRDLQLAEFLGTDPIGKMLGYKKKPHLSTFSKVRKRANPKIFKDIYDWIIHDRLKGKQIRLIAQDSSDIPARSKSIEMRDGDTEHLQKRNRKI
jgi:hypothetical protein